MADKEHSTLTGASLHEPKGADSAAANRVYVSDGLGSGAWSTVGLSTLDAAAKSFQGAYLHVQDKRSAGSTGSSMTTETWVTRQLNTEVSDPSGVGSLASNQITLAAGTYMCIGSATFTLNLFGSGNKTSSAQLRLRDVTSGTTLAIGSNHSNNGTDNSLANVICSEIRGVFTLSGTKAVELQQYSFGSVTEGSSNTTNTGEQVVFADLLIWKIS